MMNIRIAQLDRESENNGVVTVHWTASKTVGEYTASSYGTESFQPDPQSPDFKPFEELTESDVVGWLTAKEDWATNLEATLDADLDRQANPPILHGLPWSQDTQQPE